MWTICPRFRLRPVALVSAGALLPPQRLPGEIPELTAGFWTNPEQFKPNSQGCGAIILLNAWSFFFLHEHCDQNQAFQSQLAKGVPVLALPSC